MEYSVYRHTSPNGKVYIGITLRKPEYRWANGKGYVQNKHFYSAILKYGWDNITHEIIAENLDKETACAIEQALIAFHRSNQREFGYNNSIGGENPNEGHKASPEEIAYRSATHRGIRMSEQGRKNISMAKKGKPNGHEGRTGEQSQKAGIVSQIDRNTKVVIAEFYGFDEMNRETGYAKTPVKEAANGTRKQAYGYLWAYRKRR